MALLYHTYLERTSLSAPLKAAGATLVLVGILAQSGGFFLHMLIGRPGEPSLGTTITTLGAVLLVAAIVVLVNVLVILARLFVHSSRGFPVAFPAKAFPCAGIDVRRSGILILRIGLPAAVTPRAQREAAQAALDRYPLV